MIENENRCEREMERLKQHNKIIHDTDKIMSHMTDFGCALLTPNYACVKDIHKKLVDPAEKAGFAIKEHKRIQIVESDLPILFFDCPNQFPPEIIQQLLDNEVFIVFLKQWNTDKSVLKMLYDFQNYLTERQLIESEFLRSYIEEDENETQYYSSPVFKPYTIILSEDPLFIEINETNDNIIDDDTNDNQYEQNVHPNETMVSEAENDAEEVVVEEIRNLNDKRNSIRLSDIEFSDHEIDNNSLRSVHTAQAIDVQVRTVKGKTLMRTRSVWIPANERTNAALIYLYFRHVSCFE